MCKDWISHHTPCKHFFAIFEQCPGWDWSKLPKHFLGSSYLSANMSLVDKYLNMEETENEDQPNHFHCEDLSLPQLPKQKVHVHTGCCITILVRVYHLDVYHNVTQKPSLDKELVKARIALKNIKTLTYNFLSADLDELYSKYHALLPKCQGILLRPNAIQYMRRKIQKPRFTLRYSTLKQSKPKRLKASSR